MECSAPSSPPASSLPPPPAHTLPTPRTQGEGGGSAPIRLSVWLAREGMDLRPWLVLLGQLCDAPAGKGAAGRCAMTTSTMHARTSRREGACSCSDLSKPRYSVTGPRIVGSLSRPCLKWKEKSAKALMLATSRLIRVPLYLR